MKISGKTSLNIILKVTKKQGFTLSLGDTFSKKPQDGGEGGEGVQLPPSPSAILELKLSPRAMADTATLFGQILIIRVRLQYHQRFNNFKQF